MLVSWQLEWLMYDFKNSFSPGYFYIYRANYIFPETYNAFTISEPDITVWVVNEMEKNSIVTFTLPLLCMYYNKMEFYFIVLKYIR